MAEDLLSQNEIDALFAQTRGTQSADEAVPERFRSVRPYDFRYPSKLSKDQLRTLQMIFESLARLVSTNLSGMLRSQVHMALVSIEQTVFGDYVQALPQRTVLNLLTVEPLPGTCVFEYDLSTGFAIVDRLLGGPGLRVPIERNATEIEEALWQNVSAVFLSSLAEAWAHIMELQPKLQKVEYSPRFLQIAPRNEPVVLLLFDVRIADAQTTMSLCIPYTCLEPIAADLNVQSYFLAAQGGTTAEHAGDLQKRLQRVIFPVVAVLGRTELPLSAVSDLRVDDVIRLDGAVSDPLRVLVDRKPTYLARPGVVRGAMGVQIVDLLNEEDLPT